MDKLHALCPVDSASPPPDIQGEHVESGNLRRESLGGRDPYLRAGVGVKRPIGLAREARIGDVADSERPRLPSLGFLYRRDRIRGLARLWYGDDKGVFVRDR